MSEKINSNYNFSYEAIKRGVKAGEEALDLAKTNEGDISDLEADKMNKPSNTGSNGNILEKTATGSKWASPKKVYFHDIKIGSRRDTVDTYISCYTTSATPLNAYSLIYAIKELFIGKLARVNGVLQGQYIGFVNNMTENSYSVKNYTGGYELTIPLAEMSISDTVDEV